MAEWKKIFDARPYHEAGFKNIAEMDAELSEKAAKAIGNLPVNEREPFRERVQQYTQWDQLPADLKKLINDNQ